MAGWDDPSHRLDAKRLERLFQELDWQVGLKVRPGSKPFNLIVCGGAAMCYLNPERGTGDVDLMHPKMPAEVRRAAKIVAKRRGLGSGWLNDGPSQFADYSVVVAPNVIYEGAYIRVSVPDNEYLLGMKVHAFRDDDIQDILWLMRDLGLSSAKDLHEAAKKVSLSIGRDWRPARHQRRAARTAARAFRRMARQGARQDRGTAKKTGRQSSNANRTQCGHALRTGGTCKHPRPVKGGKCQAGHPAS